MVNLHFPLPKTLRVQVSDVNDNKPVFSQNPYELYLVENNIPGASILSVTAADNDLNENAAITYHIVRGDGLQGDTTSFLNVKLGKRTNIRAQKFRL